MAIRNSFGAVSGQLGGLAGGAPRTAQIALQLGGRWRLTKIVGVTLETVYPRVPTANAVAFRLMAGRGVVAESTSITPADTTSIAARGGVVSDLIADVSSKPGVPVVLDYGDNGPIIGAGEAFFALVGVLLYDDGTTGGATNSVLGSIAVQGIMLDGAKEISVSLS